MSSDFSLRTRVVFVVSRGLTSQLNPQAVDVRASNVKLGEAALFDDLAGSIESKDKIRLRQSLYCNNHQGLARPSPRAEAYQNVSSKMTWRTGLPKEPVLAEDTLKHDFSVTESNPLRTSSRIAIDFRE